MGFYKSLFGENNFQWFLNKIDTKAFQMRDFLKLIIKPKITNKSKNFFIKTNICWLCHKEIKDMKDKVKH